MTKRRVFLLQENPSLNEELKRLFTESGEFEVVGCACDGITGLEMIEDKKPSFVVMELALAGYENAIITEIHIKRLTVAVPDHRNCIVNALLGDVSTIVCKIYKVI